MKYKLINKQTKEETLCDKITIDGFDYYMSDEKLKVKDKFYFKVDGVSDILEVESEFHLERISGYLENKKVIATNNPNIDVPQILEEPNETLIHQIAADLGYRMLPDDLEEGIKAGYKESQETHPFSEEDMIEFNEWCSKNYEFDNRCNHWFHGNGYYTTKELLQLWKEQKPKIVYYE